jgi:hypoxia up-regulated 1
MKERQGKPDIRENPRAVKRLLKEVVKVKDILSANKNMQVKVGELADYVTLMTTIERKEFEDAAAPLFERAMSPIYTAL